MNPVILFMALFLNGQPITEPVPIAQFDDVRDCSAAAENLIAQLTADQEALDAFLTKNEADQAGVACVETRNGLVEM